MPDYCEAPPQCPCPIPPIAMTGIQPIPNDRTGNARIERMARESYETRRINGTLPADHVFPWDAGAVPTCQPAYIK